MVFAKGYKEAGYTPVRLSDSMPVTLDIMLIPDDPGLSFVDARWPSVSAKFPFLGSGTTAQTSYENLIEKQPLVIACLLNLVEAMSQIFLASGTPLQYVKEIRWDRAPQQDRFFAYCDAKSADEVSTAARNDLFSQESGSAIFHPGPTNSWKQIQFGEANVQLTFHENLPDRRSINGVDCVTLVPDIDYYRDLGAHAIFEVMQNGLNHTLTNPLEVYVLRWIAGQHAGVPQFQLLNTIVGTQIRPPPPVFLRKNTSQKQS